MTEQEMIGFFAPPDIMKCKKALCIQPHPDDIEIGMGGIVPVLVKNGVKVEYLTITDGSLGAYVKELKGEILAEVRRNEAVSAGTLLGATGFHFLDKEDGTLSCVNELAWEIAEIIREGEFDLICCPDPWLSYEGHNDHVVAGKAAAQAFICANLLEYPKNTKTKPFTPSAIAFYFTKKPNTVVDITETFEMKMQAVSMHKSQINEELLALYTAYFGMRGQKLAENREFELGEGLKVLSPIHMHCFPESEEI